MSTKWWERRDGKTQNTEILIHIACICIHMNKNFNFGSYESNIMTREVGGGYVTSVCTPCF